MEAKIEQSTTTKSIYLDDSLFGEPTNLYAFLVNLYLGPIACYTLQFKTKHINIINRIFDQIILFNRPTPVTFKFRLL